MINLLREHDHFARFAAVEYMDRVELGKQQPLLEQWLSDEDAAAFGWTSAYTQLQKALLRIGVIPDTLPPNGCCGGA